MNDTTVHIASVVAGDHMAYMDVESFSEAVVYGGCWYVLLSAVFMYQATVKRRSLPRRLGYRLKRILVDHYHAPR